MAPSEKTAQSASIWRRLDKIKHDDPSLNSETWFTVQPCRTVNFFAREIVITQPSSTFWVTLLGVLTSLLGAYFIATYSNQTSRMMWGVSLILWGVGALLAGTSYQAFGYQLKCADRPQVVWTSWWEVVYLIFQQVSVSVMLVAVAYSGLTEHGQALSIAAAILVSVIYTIVVCWGAFTAIKALITIELMVHFCTPFMVFFIGLNAWRYWQFGNDLDLALLGTWFGLVLTMVIFNKYDSSGLTDKLWKKGKWFSENDALHVALIVWVIYIALVVEPLVKDISG
jgi:hypothetical protein